MNFYAYLMIIDYQGSNWDRMKRYAILGLPLAGTGMVIISIPGPLFSKFEPC